MIQNKINLFIKYIIIYSIFITLTLFTKMPGKIFNFIRLFPDFNIIFIFLVISWIDDDFEFINITQNNFFVFGLIIDTIEHLPLGVSSLALLLSNKIVQQFRMYFLNDNSLFYFVRDVSIFLFFYLLFAWFIISFYKSSFYPMSIILATWLKDILASYFIYFIYKKLKNYV